MSALWASCNLTNRDITNYIHSHCCLLIADGLWPQPDTFILFWWSVQLAQTSHFLVDVSTSLKMACIYPISNSHSTLDLLTEESDDLWRPVRLCFYFVNTCKGLVSLVSLLFSYLLRSRLMCMAWDVVFSVNNVFSSSLKMLWHILSTSFNLKFVQIWCDICSKALAIVITTTLSTYIIYFPALLFAVLRFISSHRLLLRRPFIARLCMPLPVADFQSRCIRSGTDPLYPCARVSDRVRVQPSWRRTAASVAPSRSNCHRSE